MSEKKKHKRQFLVILLIVFLGFLGISMPYLIFPALFLNPAYSILPSSWDDSTRALFLGITLAAYPLGQFIGSPILGSLSDDYGRKKLLSGSLVIAAIFNLISGIAIGWQHLGLLIASRFITGFMEGNIAIVRAMAADITTISKHETFGKINAAASIAFLLGPLLGGILTEKDLFHDLTVSTPFYLTCTCYWKWMAPNLLFITCFQSTSNHFFCRKPSSVFNWNGTDKLSFPHGHTICTHWTGRWTFSHFTDSKNFQYGSRQYTG